MLTRLQANSKTFQTDTKVSRKKSDKIYGIYTISVWEALSRKMAFRREGSVWEAVRDQEKTASKCLGGS